jgi:hypothetical protein
LDPNYKCRRATVRGDENGIRKEEIAAGIDGICASKCAGKRNGRGKVENS